MTAIRLATFDDLPHLTPLVAAFHQEKELFLTQSGAIVH